MEEINTFQIAVLREVRSLLNLQDLTLMLPCCFEDC